MNLPPLKTRAATLRTQLDARFAHGNKRSLSHCEAMDVLAACDGDRSRASVLQREAAGSAPAAVEPADATEPLAPPVPLEEQSHWRTPTIPFVNQSGYLGAGTNGAAPEAVSGLFLEASIDGYRYRGEPGKVSKSFWLKAELARTASGDRPDTDYLAYFGDAGVVERLMGRIIECQLGVISYDTVQNVDAYRNSAQLAYDEEADEGAIEDQAALVRKQEAGFRCVIGKIRPHPGLPPVEKTVATLQGDLGAAGAQQLAIALRDLLRWDDARQAWCERSLREQERPNPLPRAPSTGADLVPVTELKPGDFVDMEAIRLREIIKAAPWLSNHYAEVAAVQPASDGVSLNLKDAGTAVLPTGTRVHRRR